MYTTIKDLKGSKLVEWNGYNNSFYQTSNRLLKAWHNEGRNNLLNSATIKQALKYDSRLFNKMLTEGVAFKYQYLMIELKASKRFIKVTITNTKTETETKVNLTKNSAKRLVTDYKLNNDTTDVFNALLETIA